jgi:hypothetical protein
LALWIKHPFSQQNLQPSHEFVVAILEKHLFCAQHYAQMIEQKVKQMELAKTKLYTFGLQKLIKIFGRITMMLIRIITLCHKFGFKAVAILLFLILAAQ